MSIGNNYTNFIQFRAVNYNNWFLSDSGEATLLDYDGVRGKIYDKKTHQIRNMTKKEKAERFLNEAIGKSYVDDLLGPIIGSGTFINKYITTCS